MTSLGQATLLPSTHSLIGSAALSAKAAIRICRVRLHILLTRPKTKYFIISVEKVDYQLAYAVMFGPVWVSKHEGFNPVGSEQYLAGLISDFRSQLRGAKLVR